MAEQTPSNSYGTTELFRFATVRQPEILDLELRARGHASLKDIMSLKINSRRDWAKEFLSSKSTVADINQLKYNYLGALKQDSFPEKLLPSRHDIADESKFDGDVIRSDADYQNDLEKILTTVVAHKIAGDETAARISCRLLQFIETYPDLQNIKTARPYAPPVLQKFKHTVIDIPADTQPTDMETQINDEPATTLATDIELLWRARNLQMQSEWQKLEDAHVEHQSKRTSIAKKSTKSGKQKKKKTDKTSSRAYASELRKRKDSLAKARARYRALDDAQFLPDVLNDESSGLETALTKLSDRRLGKLQDDIKQARKDLGLKGAGLCEAYDEAVRKQDSETVRPKREDKLRHISLGTCFAENPRIKFQTAIRPLGCGALVTVKETFLKYTEGEINYIENILAGEIRRREVKDTKYAEQIVESETQEITDLTTETSSKVSSDLRSQIESELNTQFNTDVNASASGSGGGSIGVVDFAGSASLDTGIGIGVDTSLSSSTETNFAQEILNKSVEKTRTSTLERRVDRTYTLYETTNLHEINNTIGDTISHRRGIYCFLDKQVCISESVYGHRMFLMANVILPGKNLICEKQARRILDMQDQAEPPEFDITPDEVQPGNYKELVGRYRAGGISPPPEPIIRLARTYKTDQTNAETEKGGGFDLKKVADTLVPFFENYQRNLITDTIKLPDGYQVQEVKVMVNHGANGISVPAHLPISLAGATIYSLPLLGYSALFPMIYLPISLWQIAYLASPMMHYNTDSSNVTVCVGTESQDSAYYFFSPEFLVPELFEMLGNFTALAPGILSTIQNEAQNLLQNLQNNAAGVPADVVNLVSSALQNIVQKINDAFNAVIAALDPTTGEIVPSPGGELKDIALALTDLTNSITIEATNLQNTMGEFFDPLNDFFENIFAHIQEGIEESISDFFSLLLDTFDNSQRLSFFQSYGARRELPISFNVVSIKPGITINLDVCLRRTDEALDKWRLVTFSSLYQAHLQQVAEYESRNFAFEKQPRLARSPGTMRAEEHLALKEILLHALNNYHEDDANNYSLERINLFENAIDWKNISFKLHNYGPNLAKVQMERLGFFKGVDARRKVFLTAHWAQVMIPLQPSEHLETQMLDYFKSQVADLEGDLGDDELAALYQVLVQDRALSDENPQTTYRTEVLPSDLVVLKLDDELPENGATGCE